MPKLFSIRKQNVDASIECSSTHTYILHKTGDNFPNNFNSSCAAKYAPMIYRFITKRIYQRQFDVQEGTRLAASDPL